MSRAEELEAAILVWAQAHYRLSRPGPHHSGPLTPMAAAVEAEDALCRVLLAGEAQGVPAPWLVAAVAHRAGEPLLRADQHALGLQASRKRRAVAPTPEPARRKRRTVGKKNLFDGAC